MDSIDKSIKISETELEISSFLIHTFFFFVETVKWEMAEYYASSS